MTEEVIFEFERRQDRAEIAALLRSVADSLESGGPITLDSGAERVTLDPPATPTFEVKAEREGGDELSVEFELEWHEGEDAESETGELSVE